MWGWFLTFLVSAAISYKQLKELKELEQENDGALLNKQSNIAQIPVIYGTRKVGGTRVFVETSGTGNEFLYIALVLCEGEVDSIDGVWINDELSTEPKFNDLVIINKHLGADNQTADSTLLIAPSWTADHRLRGVAYLGIRLKWDREVFGSIPTIQAEVRGRKVYDPRGGGSTGYSANTALCLLDYLTNTRYGKGLPATSFEPDYASWEYSADVCDATVDPYLGGGSIKTFECNAVIKTDATVMSNVKVFLSGMRGLVPYTQGIYKLIIERAGSPIFAFTEDHIVGGLNMSGERKSDRYNRVIATFVNPDNNWQQDQIEYPDAGSTEYTDLLAEDDGFDLEHRIDLPTITNVYQAKHMAKSILKKSRQGIKCNFLSTAEALQLAIGDIVSVTHRTPGWDAKHFRVTDLGLQNDGNVAVALSEHQDSTFSWTTSDQAVIIPDTNLPDPYSVSAPTDLAVNSGQNYQVTNDNGSTSPRVYLSWDASNDSFVDYYVVQIATTDGVWDIEHRTDSSPLYISGVASGTIIDVRIKAVNAMGISSAWVTIDNHTIDNLDGGGGGGVTTFSRATPPSTDIETGDLWFETDNNNILHRYDGTNPYNASGWVALQDGSIPTGALASLDQVGSGEINVSKLSDINSDVGTMTAGTINVGSGEINIVGGTIGGSRIEIDNEAFKVYDGTTLRVTIGKL